MTIRENQLGGIMKCKLLILLLIPFVVYSQDKYGSGPEIKITFPNDKDTVAYGHIRIAGSTIPSAKVTIDDSSVKVYPSGAFVGRVKLIPEWNEIKVSATDTTATTSMIKLNIFRKPPLISTPPIPTQIDDKLVYPNQGLILFSGDLLQVRFKGSSGGKAKFSLDKICKNIPMTELKPDEADGLRGIYSGVITITTKKDRSPKPIVFELKGIDGKKVKIKTKTKVEVRTKKIPLIGELIEDTYLRNGVERWAVVNTLPSGIKLHLIGRIGEVFKVKLSNSAVGYVASENVKLLPPGTPIPQTSIGLPEIHYKGDWIQLSMPIDTACPFVISQSVDPPALELTIYGAHLSSQWITYPEEESEIKMITWSQPTASIFKLKVDLNQPQQWGHRVRFTAGRMILEIRRTPKFARPPENPMKGLIFALDAGHGGKELGAVGSTGLFEKDVNLIYTKKLAALLEDAGAKVVLTRTADSTVSLKQRVEIARKANAHIFCWLHNNSIGGASDPLAVRGTSTYFTVPQNQKLAWTIYPRLLELGLDPFGKIQSTYYITRQTDMLVVLIEGAFMSHPEDEMLLMDDLFLDSLAQAVFLGLEDFCWKQIQ